MYLNSNKMIKSQNETVIYNIDNNNFYSDYNPIEKVNLNYYSYSDDKLLNINILKHCNLVIIDKIAIDCYRRLYKNDWFKTRLEDAQNIMNYLINSHEINIKNIDILKLLSELYSEYVGFIIETYTKSTTNIYIFNPDKCVKYCYNENINEYIENKSNRFLHNLKNYTNNY